MQTYNLSLTEIEIAFLRELFQSDLAITVKSVEVVASTKTKVMSATPNQNATD